MTPHPMTSGFSIFFQRVRFGLLLGLLLSLLFLVFIFGIFRFPLLIISPLVGWVLYLVIPLLASLRTPSRALYRQKATGPEPGLETGGIGVLLNLLTGLIVFVIVSVKGLDQFLAGFAVLIFIGFILFHGVGLLLAALGGDLGKAMRKR
jgi:hypothetical protein